VENGTFQWTIAVTGDIENSGGESSDAVVGTISTTITGRGSKSPVSWSATSSPIAVVGAQSYDVEYTVNISLQGLSLNSTFEFDPPPNGGGSLGVSLTAVPEPCSCALLALGGLLLFSCGRWQRMHFNRAGSN
jgi:hypothetical protein